jgi:two-component system phosphate regulon sensor histidine kinase PhoR
MLRSGLKAEVWRCIALIAACTLIGLIAGHVTLAFAAGCCGCLIWMLVQFQRLASWIHRTRRANTPPQEELAGLWADISYDIQLLMARQEKEKLRLQAVVHRVQEMTTALADAVILVDRRGNIEWWNKAAVRLFDFRDIDQGHKLTNLIRHPKFIQYFDLKSYASPLELTMWRKDQHLEFQVHIFGDGERLVIARDITRLFKLEQMRKDFVANVSHELRTPLTVIRGYIETLADSPKLPPSWQKMVQQMEQQAQRMTLLINDLITLTKLETDQKESATLPIALAPMIASVAVDARTLSGAHAHQIEVSGAPDLALIGNEGELRSAISNLVINAINYSPAGSRIDIHYDYQPTGAVVRVRDQGIGIEPKHLPRLTERFYRVDASRSVASGGTGLGLAIVKHVLLRHNSELKIQSYVGKGSEFSCYFPQSIVCRLPPEETDAQTAG